ncbi:MAG: hypothetical protein M3383_03985 [Actinomycetota bacterium]|nr:hypothetical protein [Actinomycetota bacterium]
MHADEQIHGDESYVAEQERAAAEEALAVGGGPPRDDAADESERALVEAGQGESEGFELAEQDLIANASHEADSTPDPLHLAGEPEGAEPLGEYGEADTEGTEDA